jgi:hypothetical protein
MRPPDCRCPPSHAAFPDASVCPVHGSGTAPPAGPSQAVAPPSAPPAAVWGEPDPHGSDDYCAHPGCPKCFPTPAADPSAAPPAASSASTSATLREIDKILGDYCGFTHLGCGPRDVYLERERRALEVLRSAESARDARTRNDVLRDLRDWLESWGDGRSIANVVLAGVATEAPAPPLDEKEGKGQ